MIESQLYNIVTTNQDVPR